MKNLTETIREKRAMLEAVEDIMNYHLNDKIEWYTKEIKNETERLEGYKADNPDWTVEDWDIKNYTRSIDNCKASLDAYETIQKALEKLI